MKIEAFGSAEYCMLIHVLTKARGIYIRKGCIDLCLSTEYIRPKEIQHMSMKNSNLSDQKQNFPVRPAL